MHLHYGISYSKLCKDYSDVNYSSLREGTIDEAAYWAEMQAFLIENWKERELRLFLESIVLNGDLKPTQVIELLKYHTWITQRRGYFDVAKDILATERELKLGLKSPLQIMEEDGRDPDEVMKQWALYEEMCRRYGVNFNVKGEQNIDEKIETEDVNMNDEKNQDDAMNKARD